MTRRKGEYSKSRLDRIRFVPRLPCQVVKMPANTANGRSSFNANQVGVMRGLRGPGPTSRTRPDQSIEKLSLRLGQ
jgi:hypothetical protein